jgi:DME family drug/metabolite transporter
MTLVCIGGLVLLAADGGERSNVDPVGLVLALGAGFAYALYTVSAKRLITGGAPSEDAMACLFGIAGLLMVPVLIASGIGWLAELSGLAAALWLGAATIAAAYVLFGRGLRRLPAGIAAALVLAEPLVASFLGVVLLGERLGWLGWLGAALVALGLVAQSRLASRPGEISQDVVVA